MLLSNIVLLLLLIFSVLMLVSFVMHLISGAPWVPSNRKTIDLMLELAELKRGQTVYDLGCGDARLLIRAEKKYNTKGVGYENAPIALLFAYLNKWISRSKVEIHHSSLFKASLENAEVIFLYLGPEVQAKLAPKLKKEARSGTLIVSNTFHLPGIKPFKIFPKDRNKGTKTIHFYKITGKTAASATPIAPKQIAATLLVKDPKNPQ